jgi:hypothetical protein
MFATLKWNVLAFVGGLLLACQGPGLPDGSLCQTGDRCAGRACEFVAVDCSGGRCDQHGYCPGSSCGGDDDCEPNWTCQRILIDSASFLGILDKDDYADRCVPQCDPCPDHYTCDGSSCVYDPAWNPDGAPVVSVTAPGEIGLGVPAMLGVTAASPTAAALVSHVWHFHDGSETPGESIFHTFTAAEAIEREELVSEFFYATVEVTDAAGKVGRATAEIRRCGAVDEVCEGYSDCCDDLDCTPTADPGDDPNRGTCRPAPR